jgi:hypothetical protein
MSNPVFARLVIGAGVLLAIISLFADPLSLGRSPGFGLRQTLGVVAGALVVPDRGLSVAAGEAAPVGPARQRGTRRETGCSPPHPAFARRG